MQTSPFLISFDNVLLVSANLLLHTHFCRESGGKLFMFQSAAFNESAGSILPVFLISSSFTANYFMHSKTGGCLRQQNIKHGQIFSTSVLSVKYKLGVAHFSVCFHYTYRQSFPFVHGSVVITYHTETQQLVRPSFPTSGCSDISAALSFPPSHENQ